MGVRGAVAAAVGGIESSWGWRCKLGSERGECGGVLLGSRFLTAMIESLSWLLRARESCELCLSTSLMVDMLFEFELGPSDTLQDGDCCDGLRGRRLG